jgi:hypothetical protein
MLESRANNDNNSANHTITHLKHLHHSVKQEALFSSDKSVKAAYSFFYIIIMIRHNEG